MRRGIIAGLILGILGFYVAWPAWSGYSIRAALQSQDPTALAAKIDFDRVRELLRPTVTRKVDEGVDRYQTQLGAAGEMIIGRLRKGLVPKIVDASMNRLLTPETVIRIAAEGGTIKESLERITREQIGKGIPGNSGGEQSAPEAGPKKPRKYSISNIKSFAFGGPLSFRVGVAKDPAASEADVTAEMAFTNGDWKVVGLIPRI